MVFVEKERACHGIVHTYNTRYLVPYAMAITDDTGLGGKRGEGMGLWECLGQKGQCAHAQPWGTRGRLWQYPSRSYLVLVVCAQRARVRHNVGPEGLSRVKAG